MCAMVMNAMSTETVGAQKNAVQIAAAQWYASGALERAVQWISSLIREDPLALLTFMLLFWVEQINHLNHTDG
jgi:type II secretory pathway component PulK